MRSLPASNRASRNFCASWLLSFRGICNLEKQTGRTAREGLCYWPKGVIPIIDMMVFFCAPLIGRELAFAYSLRWHPCLLVIRPFHSIDKLFLKKRGQ